MSTPWSTRLGIPRFNRRAGEAAVVALGRAAQMVGQIALIRISTGVLSPQQLGGVTQLTALANLFNLVLVTPVSMYIVRAFREWQEFGLLSSVVRRFAWYVTAVAAASTAVATFVQRHLAIVEGFTVGWTALLVAMYLIFLPLGSLGTTGFNLLNRRVTFTLFANMPTWVGLVLAVVLFRLRPEASSWVLGQFTALAVACLALLLLPKSAPSSLIADLPTIPANARSVVAFGWPISLQAGLWWVQSQAYRFVLGRVSTPADVGLFSVGYGLAATPVAIYEGVFAQFYEPIFYDELKGQEQAGQTAAWNNYARAYIPGLVPVGVFVTLSGPFMAKLLLGQDFQTAARVVALAGLTELLRGAGAMMHHLGIAKLDNRIVLVPVAIGAVLAPSLVWVLAPMNPLLGTAAARLIAGVAVTIAMFYISRRVMPISWPLREIGRALLLCAPLAAGLLIAQLLLPRPSLFQALGVLALAGAYVVAVELKVLTILRAPSDAA